MCLVKRVSLAAHWFILIYSLHCRLMWLVKEPDNNTDMESQMRFVILLLGSFWAFALADIRGRYINLASQLVRFETVAQHLRNNMQGGNSWWYQSSQNCMKGKSKGGRGQSENEGYVIREFVIGNLIFFFTMNSKYLCAGKPSVGLPSTFINKWNIEKCTLLHVQWHALHMAVWSWNYCNLLYRETERGRSKVVSKELCATLVAPIAYSSILLS